MQVIVAAELVTTSAIGLCCNPRGVDVLSVFERIRGSVGPVWPETHSASG
jgi:hypothetical protein